MARAKKCLRERIESLGEMFPPEGILLLALGVWLGLSAYPFLPMLWGSNPASLVLAVNLFVLPPLTAAGVLYIALKQRSGKR